ncbi:MAG: hypothetical protein H7Y04_04335 [Verrucomicrobia bacterium]|nr:hypothetical protein [Cytophagales bacterium]
MQRRIKSLILSVQESIIQFFRAILLLGEWISVENHSGVNMSFKKRLTALWYGFYSESFAMYFYEGNRNYQDFFSDYQQSVRMPNINRRNGVLLADKVIFYDFMLPYRQYLPTIYALINEGKFVDFSGKYPVKTFSDLRSILTEEKALVLKPISDYGGSGVIVAKLIDNQLFINNQAKIWADLEKQVATLDNYMVVKFIRQHAYAEAVFAGSTNTIRILTMIDTQTQKAFIADIFHRFGTDESTPVDNWAKGGLLSFIDEKTGILGETIYRTPDRKIKISDNHPDNQHLIKGTQIPNWECIKTKILEMAEYAHHCPYVGWDVVPQENGFYMLEGNDCPNVTQFRNPLLANPQTKAFYQHYKVIK